MVIEQNISTKCTLINAFDKACEFGKSLKHLIFHSDRGVQYACNEISGH